MRWIKECGDRAGEQVSQQLTGTAGSEQEGGAQDRRDEPEGVELSQNDGGEGEGQEVESCQREKKRRREGDERDIATTRVGGDGREQDEGSASGLVPGEGGARPKGDSGGGDTRGVRDVIGGNRGDRRV